MCPHENVRIVEEAMAYTTHDFSSKSGKWTHRTDFGDYTGAVDVICHDCGLHKLYRAPRLPKWVSKRLDEVVCCNAV